MASWKEGNCRGESAWEAVRSAEAAATDGLQSSSFISATVGDRRGGQSVRHCQISAGKQATGKRSRMALSLPF